MCSIPGTPAYSVMVSVPFCSGQLWPLKWQTEAKSTCSWILLPFAESLVFRALVTSPYQHMAAFSPLQLMQCTKQDGQKCRASSFYNTVTPHCSTQFFLTLYHQKTKSRLELSIAVTGGFWGSRSTGIMEIKSCAVLVYSYCLYHYSLWPLQQGHWVTSARSPGKPQLQETSAPWQRPRAGTLLV